MGEALESAERYGEAAAVYGDTAARVLADETMEDRLVMRQGLLSNCGLAHRRNENWDQAEVAYLKCLQCSATSFRP